MLQEGEPGMMKMQAQGRNASGRRGSKGLLTKGKWRLRRPGGREVSKNKTIFCLKIRFQMDIPQGIWLLK